MDKTESYYSELFTKSDRWIMPYPNNDEALRWAKICEFMSHIYESEKTGLNDKIRILEIGCGRGWLTNLVSIFGEIEGIDPVEESIKRAKQSYPHINFYSEEIEAFLQRKDFRPYDIIISSEVIEHVIKQNKFVDCLHQSVKYNGYAIITTPRKELYNQWEKLGFNRQPVEKWLTEKEMISIFCDNGFSVVKNDRIYVHLPDLTLIHKICSSGKIYNLLRTANMTWLHNGLKYLAGLYQIWCFKKTGIK